MILTFSGMIPFEVIFESLLEGFLSVHVSFNGFGLLVSSKYIFIVGLFAEVKNISGKVYLAEILDWFAIRVNKGVC